MIWKQYCRNVLTATLSLLVRTYQVILSPVLGGQCRYWPTCSDYALQALETHRPLQALSLICKRVLRCHPFEAGGYDPVPETHPGNP